MSPRAVLLLVIATLATLSGCGNKPPPPPPPRGPEICDNKKDDNGDGKVDCIDPKCFTSSACTGGAEICDNGVDDNADSKVDCLDSLCEGLACGAGCTCVSAGSHETDCGDFVDNDGDTLADCADPDCAQYATCFDAGAGGGAGGSGGNGGGGTGGGSGGGSGGGTGGGGSAGGSGGSGGGAAGGAGGGGTTTEVNCADNLDNDNDGKTDCDDPDCVTRTCGMGCQCVLNRKKEISCSDGADNDNDGKIDCLDPDCVGAGTEICNDGIDNTCDRAIDCGDPKCVGNPLCTSQQDGKGCTTNSQCAGGLCYTEAAYGAPNGTCSNAVPCSPSAQTGCNGGYCNPAASCKAKCTGTGLGATGRCRPGYVCADTDLTAGNNNNTCGALCTSDSECAGSGTGYGCNPWSKLCESKDKGLARYGAACTNNNQCESHSCYTGPSFPGGYCAGPCRGDTKSCGTGGVCEFFPSYGDNIGDCYAACSPAGLYTCAGRATYQCRTRTPLTYCSCGEYDEVCDFDSDCCSGSCDTFSGGYCN